MTANSRFINFISMTSGYVLATSIIYFCQKALIITLVNPNDSLIEGVLSVHDLIITAIAILIVKRYFRMLPKY